MKYLNESELKGFFQLVKQKKNIRNELLFRFTYHYGLRVQEAINIRIKDIHPKLIEMKIHRVKNGIERTYPLCANDIILLKKWLKKRSKHPYANENPYLFITSHSTMNSISKITAQKLFEKYATESGIEKKRCHPHVLRHSCAIQLLMNGNDVVTVKNWLGHNSIQSTLRYLEIAVPEWKKIATGIINKFAI